MAELEAVFRRAVEHHLAGRLEAAGRDYQTVLAAFPDHAPSLHLLGALAFQIGQVEPAINLIAAAIAVDGTVSAYHNDLGEALRVAGRLDEAGEQYRVALALEPGNVAALNNLGIVEQAQGRLEEAVALYEALLKADPTHVQALVNLGQALQRQGRPDEALPYFEAALACAPDLPSARWNAGLCRLLLGDLGRGWEGFRHRWEAGAVPPHGLAGPEWTGEALGHRRLLIHAEQGLGDTIQFARYLQPVQERARGEVVLLCQPPVARLLAPLIRTTSPEELLPNYDCRMPLLDLPRLFGTELGTIDGHVPYLAVNPAQADAWRAQLADLPAPRIGLVWRGRPDHKNDRNRSIPAATLAPLTRLPFGWISLQQGATAAELTALGDPRQLGDGFGDLQDAADAIAALDLVIAVDTALAHLAGALGKKVWILLPLAPDWRWLTSRDDSPWYPTARLFRQTVRGDWTTVIDRVVAAVGAEFTC
jgi:Flp pilus assembly protein TadD